MCEDKISKCVKAKKDPKIRNEKVDNKNHASLTVDELCGQACSKDSEEEKSSCDKWCRKKIKLYGVKDNEISPEKLVKMKKILIR